MRDTQLPYTVSVVLFNLLGSTTYQCACCISHCHYVQFSTLPLTTRYTTASTFHVAFPTAISSLLFNTQTQHLTTPSTVRVAFPIEIVYLHLPQPASTTALTTPSSFRVAFSTTISSLHVVHLANTTNSTFFSLFDFRKIPTHNWASYIHLLQLLDFRKIHYKAYPLSDHPTDQLSPPA